MTRSRLQIVAVSLLGAAVIGALGWGVWAYLIPDEDADLASASQTATDDTAEARFVIESRFPHGLVTFGKVFVHGDGDAAAVCGQVDISQPEDSFDGPERFVLEDHQLTLDEADGAAATTAKWRDVCEG